MQNFCIGYVKLFLTFHKSNRVKDKPQPHFENQNGNISNTSVKKESLFCVHGKSTNID